jgi:4-hydroxy-3-methylbut-2-enyl diphosphate reductase
LDNGDERIYTIGPIIHNSQVVEYLSSKGVLVVEDINEITEKGNVVIRTLGVIPEVYMELDKKGLSFTDATCPYVKMIQ